MKRHALGILLVTLLAAIDAGAQSRVRRLTTIDALRQFPGFYHLQSVLLRGEFVTEDTRTMLRAHEDEIRVLFEEGVSAPSGPVDARGVLIDIGRLDPGDPRAGSFAEGRDSDKWPRPGEQLLLRVSGVIDAPPSSGMSIRGIAIEPWRYEGESVTIVGNFRGRNLFGDLPGAPGKSRYDFVLRGTEGAIWVTDLRPRGQGFDLDVNRRVDTDRWLQVSGTITREKGLVSLKATRLALAQAPTETAVAEEPALPAALLSPVEVVFNSPSDSDTDVSGTAPIRIQFSRGLSAASIEGRVRLSYVGADGGTGVINFKLAYDAGSRSIQINPVQRLEPYRTVRVELLEGITAFDGGPLKPWTMTFSAGG